MGSVYGERVKVTLFGESHGRATGCTVDGLPAGMLLNQDFLDLRLLQRRRGTLFVQSYSDFLDESRLGIGDKGGDSRDFSSLVTKRSEPDKFEFLSGVSDTGVCLGSPLTAVFPNVDVQSEDYAEMRMHFRPGHADYVSFVRSNGFADLRGGGHFSGRITAPFVLAGALCEQILADRGIAIRSEISSIGAYSLPSSDSDSLLAYLRELETVGDSVGARIRVTVSGMPVGVGSPFFDTLEGEISKVIFAVPGVKGIEFGDGFRLAEARGSESVDAFYSDEVVLPEEKRKDFVLNSGISGGILSDDASKIWRQVVKTRSNHNGGINGGLSNGMPIVFSVAVKPTSSIGIPVETLHFLSMKQDLLQIKGRHDKCIGLRAIVAITAATAIALINLLE